MNATRRRASALVTCFGIGLGMLGWAGAASAQPKTELTLTRYFGSCEPEYGANTDLARARGECGIITTLINKFNAENKDGIVVKPQVVEWNGYYDQMSARIVARDVPAIAVMHTAVLGDFVRRRLVEPLDADFNAVGIDTADFTPSARAVLYDGKPYALPWDTAAMLWHVNVGLMRQAGLVDGSGKARVPSSAEELLAMAREFRERTGKPLLVLATSPDKASNARVFHSLLYQQDGNLFPDGSKSSFNSPAVRNTYTVLKQLYNEGHIIKSLNYANAMSAFLNGQGGVMLNGTWVIDTFLDNAARPDSALKDGYDVQVVPTLFGKPSTWIDSQTWVLLRGGTNAQTRKAAQVFLKYMWDNNREWARTGHLPARQSVLDSAWFHGLPMRDRIEDVPRIGHIALPQGTPRAFTIQDIIGEEISAMFVTGKPVDDVVRDTERRVNDLLANAR